MGMGTRSCTRQGAHQQRIKLVAQFCVVAVLHGDHLLLLLHADSVPFERLHGTNMGQEGAWHHVDSPLQCHHTR